MQNTGNFKHVYIARFEASLKYVILKYGLKKHCYTNNQRLQMLKI